MLRLKSWAAGALALAGAVIAPALAVAVPAAPAAADTTTHTPVMGPSLLTATQLANWFQAQSSGTPQLPDLPGATAKDQVTALAQLFIDEGRTEGLRGDIAFVQSTIETAWFSFPSYGQIRPWFHNYAGINAFNNRPIGTTCDQETDPTRCFDTPALGVRTQIHLLRGYADITSKNLPDRLKMPPADRIGVAPYWEQFGGQSGKAIWATAIDYGTTIVARYQKALVFNGANAACLPLFTGDPQATSGKGYWMLGSDGGVFSFGSAVFHGSTGGVRLNQPVLGITPTTTGGGYWFVAGDGGIFSFGDAAFYGSTGNIKLNQPVVGMGATSTGAGYWMVARDGGIFSFGDAAFYGSTGGIKLAKPIVGMAPTPSGKGYWLVASDGGVFSFGDAGFFGSTGAVKLAKPIVSMTPTPTGKGYWLLASDGGVFTFGDATFAGSLAGCTNYKPSRQIVASPAGGGYWIVTEDGVVVGLGDARRLGSPTRINGVGVGLAVVP